MSLGELPAVRGVPSVTAARMAEIDRAAIDGLGIPELALMENAAAAVARVARLVLGDPTGRRVVALAGSGNNGGDAAAAARRLAGWGAAASVVYADPERVQGAARVQRDVCAASGVAVRAWDGTAIERADLLIDGLLGYSARGAPRPPLDALIRAANAAGVPIVAVDLPSGVDPDTGVADGAAIRATVTVTLGLPKRGLVDPVARALVGTLVLADIGIAPPALGELAEAVTAIFARGELVQVTP